MTPYNVLIQWKRCFKLAKIITANILYKTATITLNKPLFNGVQVRVVLNWYLFFICFHLLFCNILHQRVLLARLFSKHCYKSNRFFMCQTTKTFSSSTSIILFHPNFSLTVRSSALFFCILPYFPKLFLVHSLSPFLVLYDLKDFADREEQCCTYDPYSVCGVHSGLHDRLCVQKKANNCW